MGAISVVLGLLPAGLTQIGPSTSHFSLLASRRPLLATLLSFGALTVQPMDSETVASLRKPVRLPETGVPLFWALFPVVAQLFSHLAMWIQFYRRRKSYGVKDIPYELTTRSPSVSGRVIREVTPSSWGSPIVAPESPGTERGSLLMLELAVTQIVNLCSIAHVFMGTIILSTMQFISLRNAVIILVRVLSGAIFVKAVVQYELYGMREVSQGKDSDDNEL
ncbi:hypothetical protein LQW54_002058 [Pestalotiopsis sp. IQ-011]